MKRKREYFIELQLDVWLLLLFPQLDWSLVFIGSWGVVVAHVCHVERANGGPMGQSGGVCTPRLVRKG